MVKKWEWGPPRRSRLEDFLRWIVPVLDDWLFIREDDMYKWGLSIGRNPDLIFRDTELPPYSEQFKRKKAGPPIA